MTGIEVLMFLLFGGALMFFGRRLFWICGAFAFGLVGAILAALVLEPSAVVMDWRESRGFSVTMDVQSEITSVTIAAAVAAVIGILITLRFPKIAAMLVGFVGGILILVIVALVFDLRLIEWVWRSVLLIGGTILGIVGYRNHDQAMILLSTIAGANIIAFSLNLDPNAPAAAILWLILMLVGIVYQSNDWRVRRRKVLAVQAQN